MAGIGAEGAFGAAGTFAGLQDWMRQRRQQVVEGQQDTLFQQGQEDRAAAKVQEQALARQKLLEQQTAQQEQADMLGQIDALDLPPLAKLGAKISIKQGKTLPPELLSLLKPKEPKLQFAPNGQLVDLSNPELAGQNFAAPKEAPKPRIQIAPNGQVVNLDDPSILGKNFAAPRERSTAQEPLVAIKDPVTGQPVLVPRSQAAGKAPASTRDQAMTEGQSNAAGFADRMKFNEQPIRAFEKEAASPLARIGGILPREMQSAARQQYDAAKSNWIAANLRKESGAAIGKEEYANADVQYFPQPGDTPATIEQKRQLRAVAEAAMRRSSGHAAAAGGGGVASEPGAVEDPLGIL